MSGATGRSAKTNPPRAIPARGRRLDPTRQVQRAVSGAVRSSSVSVNGPGRVYRPPLEGRPAADDCGAPSVRLRGKPFSRPSQPVGRQGFGTISIKRQWLHVIFSALPSSYYEAYANSSKSASNHGLIERDQTHRHGSQRSQRALWL